MIDKILQSRYKITEYIGCGGMAEVYKAKDMLLERDVAIKILRPQFSSDENFINKFRREAQSAAALTDSNIVSVFDVGHEDKFYYIVMEYVAGSTLQKLINNTAPLLYDNAIFIAKGIAHALEKAHAGGIIHCDIKPHNILLDESGNAKVSDFGIARAISSTTITFDGAVLGSVHYLSPEQAKGEAVTYSSDIYSLGVVLFEMLTGKLPFGGETPIAVAMQHVQAAPPLLRDFNDQVPAVLEAVVSKALAKNPQDRYASAEEFIQAIELAQACIEGNTELVGNDATMLLPKVKQQTSFKDKASEKLKTFWQSKFGKAAALSALLLTGFVIGIYVVFGQFAFTNDVKVPNLVGKERSEAVALLGNSNLEAVVAEEFDPNVPLGFVIHQEPEQGAIVKEFRQVNLIISKGPELISVPDLIGKNINMAYAELAKYSLRIGKIEEQEDKEKEPGTIIAQNPTTPAHVGINSKVDIVVATQKAKVFVMPDLKGMTTNEARTKLAELKLKINDIQDRYTDQQTGGTVVDQSPAPGQETNEGAEVIIVVARSLTEQAKQGIVEFVVPSGSSKQTVRIVVTDSRSRRTVYEGQHKAGERIRQTVDGIGSVRVQFYSNSRLVEEKLI